MNQHIKDWINNATYEELLEKRRFEPVGSPYFCGLTGEYYILKMKEKRAEIGDVEACLASKRIGWM